MSADVTKDLLEALKGLLVRAADDEEYGPDHAVTVARAAIARAEAALAKTQPDADGWLPWAGGKCPVNLFAIVIVEYRNGTFDDEYFAYQFDWKNTGHEYDIIAYRVVK